jgi:hypothetical protein
MAIKIEHTNELESLDKLCKELRAVQRKYFLPHESEWERITLTLSSLEAQYMKLHDKFTANLESTK